MDRRPTILIVEDNVDHLEHLRDALGSQYTVFEANSKDGCLRMLSQQDFDLIVLDYYLSNSFSGLDILHEIVQNNMNIPIVMVTAYGNEELAVEAMKSGAEDYIRKTLDNSYIERLLRNIEDIVARRNHENGQDVKREVLGFFEENRKNFIARWKERIRFQKERLGLKGLFQIDDFQIDRLFSAFLADIQNKRTTETLRFLKKMVLLPDVEERSLIAGELLNITFADIARQMLFEKYPNSFDNRTMLMRQIGAIVDENDLELSREYERLIRDFIQRAQQLEQVATKSQLLTTLQHRIRQPLTYIYNTAELLLADRSEVTDDSIRKLIDQAQRIEDILTQLEKDGHVLLKQYSDGSQMIDMQEADE